jgi:hypothetical protein
VCVRVPVHAREDRIHPHGGVHNGCRCEHRSATDATPKDAVVLKSYLSAGTPEVLVGLADSASGDTAMIVCQVVKWFSHYSYTRT